MGQLHSQLSEPDASPQDLIDAYLFAKQVLAESMQALLRDQLPESCPAFRELRERLSETLTEQFGGRIPAKYLKVPYGTRIHEELFSILLQRAGEPVPAMMLRIIAADSVHAERRMRELRELGLDIHAGKAQGTDVYTLCSLEIDPSLTPSIIGNLIKKDKSLPKQEKDALLASLEA
ncbi:hypothetical protein OHV05_16875 [Kitasatospora sp. NBC_00070]|uniref:hypothetical protein n=1 Tax=Kitasatospora sp. NBC_00070 TaxID=2975962 RepID=UPI003253149D